MGNSHTASLKKGWDIIQSEFPSVTFTFYAKKLAGLSSLVVNKGKLITHDESLKAALRYTSNGDDCIDLSSFDGCILYGLGLRVPKHSSDIFYSNSVIRLTAEDLVYRSLSWELLNKIRQISNLKVYIGHNPLHTVKYNPAMEISTLNYLKYILVLNESIFSLHNALLQPQPEITLCNDFNTKIEYSSNAPRLNSGVKLPSVNHLADDNSHMNGEFGAIYLRQFLYTNYSLEPA